MKKLALLFSIIVLTCGICFAQTSGFTYQGKLADAGAPANGIYQLECKLFDAATVGIQAGSTQTVVATVTNGVFTTRLDFGAPAFPAGADRWLEIGVRLNGSVNPYTVLSPRQQVNSVPFAVRSLNATTADNATNLAGVTAGNYVQTSDTRLSDARTPTAGSADYIQNTTAQQASTNFNVSGDGTVGGTLNANVFNATTQYNIGGNRVLSSSGIGNLFAGVGAGQNGSNNSFFGVSSGSHNLRGVFNNFVGFQAGVNNNTGSNNTFIGVNSGLSNTLEDNNTFIGNNANGAAGITNATALGSQSKVTQSNSLVLGGINGVNNASADTNVGIGTTAPAFKLEVVDSTNTGLRVQTNTSGGTVASFAANGDFQIDAPNIPGGRFIVRQGGNVGIGTASPAEKLSVAGTVQSTSGGFKFPDGSVQTTAAAGNTTFTTVSNIPDFVPSGPSESILHLNLPTGGDYLMTATVTFWNSVAGVNNARMFTCKFDVGVNGFDQDYHGTLAPSGFSTTTFHAVLNLNIAPAFVDLQCHGNNQTGIQLLDRRLTAVKLAGNVVVQ